MARGEIGDGIERRVWSVSAIVGAAREVLEEAWPFLSVRGEVTGFHAHASGHWYFELKDEGAALRTVMFRGANRNVPFRVENGLEMIVGGNLTIYQNRGSFQMIVDAIEPVGWGALELAFEQLKERLSTEGLFDPARKRPLPFLPTCVGVVTAETGAAWKDITRVWQRREVALRAILAPCRVQGKGAAEEIAGAIDTLCRQGDAEVLIVGRGGGSREDLWAFNEEVVARAIAAAPVPVVSAVGHEIDVTIADLVADVRAATPTAAAEIVAPSRSELSERTRGALRRARASVVDRVLRGRRRLDGARRAAALREPTRALRAYQQRLDDAWTNLGTALDRGTVRRHEALLRVQHRIAGAVPPARIGALRQRSQAAARRARVAATSLVARRGESLSATAARVEALSPVGVLSRGYSICRASSDGGVVRDPNSVQIGDSVEVIVELGSIDCAVLRRRRERDGS